MQDRLADCLMPCCSLPRCNTPRTPLRLPCSPAEVSLSPGFQGSLPTLPHAGDAAHIFPSPVTVPCFNPIKVLPPTSLPANIFPRSSPLITCIDVPDILCPYILIFSCQGSLRHDVTSLSGYTLCLPKMFPDRLTTIYTPYDSFHIPLRPHKHSKVFGHTFYHFCQILCFVLRTAHKNIPDYQYTFFLYRCTHSLQTDINI